jgi:hypothetical protein
LVSVAVIALMAVLAGANGPTAIAKWAVEVNGGLLSLESTTGSGNCTRRSWRPSITAYRSRSIE